MFGLVVLCVVLKSLPAATLPLSLCATLMQVRVYLRNMEEGLPGFTQAWNSWVDHKSPPVLTILQGSGPVSTAGVVLEVSACTGR